MARSIKLGFVYEFDGYVGIIQDENNVEYYFNDKDILNNEKINVKDIVCFLNEEYEIDKKIRRVARFIRPYEKYKVYVKSEMKYENSFNNRKC